MCGDFDVGSDEGTAIVLVPELFAEITERFFHVAVSGVVSVLIRIEERVILKGTSEFVSVVVDLLRLERSIRTIVLFTTGSSQTTCFKWLRTGSFDQSRQ